MARYVHLCRRRIATPHPSSQLDDDMAEFEEDAPYPCSRPASALVAAFCVIGTFAIAGPVRSLEVFAFCLLPLGCIWFPEALGDWDGSSRMTHINAASPGSFVWLLGWVVLLVPAVAGGIIWIGTH